MKVGGESDDGRPLTEQDDDDLYRYIHLLPKVELHAHLHGCIRESTLRELATERNVELSHLHLRPGRPDIHPSTSSWTHSDPHHLYDPFPWWHNLQPRSLKDCFDIFAELPACINDLVALRRITQEALEDFAAENTIYLELRSTPKRLSRQYRPDDDPNNNKDNHHHTEADLNRRASKFEYVETILTVMEEFHQSEQERYIQQQLQQLASLESPGGGTSPIRPVMTCRFLVAVDRSQSLEEATENIELALEFRSPQQRRPHSWVVGVDLGGNPHRQDFRQFEHLFARARQEARLGITLHCAEIPCSRHHDDDDVDEEDEEEDSSSEPSRVVKLRDEVSRARAEVEAMLRFRPDRLGHALLLPPDLQAVLGELQIPVETCPTSNVMTLELAKLAGGNLLHGLTQHPALQEWLDRGHPLAVGTDDPGVFDTNLTKELWLVAKAHDLSREAIASLSCRAIDFAFCDDECKSAIAARMREHMNGLNDYGGGKYR